jgi:aspartyl-tRNA(Asn)/glutamyl-tRNA(Gln) amidotransferase subunit C
MIIDDLKETAALAHLNMGEEELAGAFPAFEQMLGYFAAMQAADQEGGAAAGKSNPPVSGTGGTVESGHFRGDVTNVNPANNSSQDPAANLLDRAGERDGRFVVVPNVL